LPIQNAALKANSQGGLLTLETLRGSLYKGTFAANGSLDVREDVPVVACKPGSSKYRSSASCRAQGQTPPVKGQMTLDSNVTGSGNSQKALIDSLNGTASFVINNGVLLNANLEQQLCTGIATAQPQNPERRTAQQRHTVQGTQGQPGASVTAWPATRT
jgi:AsmA protein